MSGTGWSAAVGEDGVTSGRTHVAHPVRSLSEHRERGVARRRKGLSSHERAPTFAANASWSRQSKRSSTCRRRVARSRALQGRRHL